MRYLTRRSHAAGSFSVVEPAFAGLLNLMRQVPAYLLLTLSVLLCSCAGFPGSGQRNVTDASTPLGPAVDQFSISGRLLLKQGQRQDHLRFTWEHTPITDALLLNGALGQGVAKLTRNVQARPSASLELADGKRYQAANWEALSQQVFGQALPLDTLPQWLRGANAEWSGAQDKWRIIVTEAKAFESAPGGQHQLMPRAIQISGDDVVMNIVVESWGDDDE